MKWCVAILYVNKVYEISHFSILELHGVYELSGGATQIKVKIEVRKCERRLVISREKP